MMGIPARLPSLRAAPLSDTRLGLGAALRPGPQPGRSAALGGRPRSPRPLGPSLRLTARRWRLRLRAPQGRGALRRCSCAASVGARFSPARNRLGSRRPVLRGHVAVGPGRVVRRRELRRDASLLRLGPGAGNGRAGGSPPYRRLRLRFPRPATRPGNVRGQRSRALAACGPRHGYTARHRPLTGGAARLALSGSSPDRARRPPAPILAGGAAAARAPPSACAALTRRVDPEPTRLPAATAAAPRPLGRLGRRRTGDRRGGLSSTHRPAHKSGPTSAAAQELPEVGSAPLQSGR